MRDSWENMAEILEKTVVLASLSGTVPIHDEWAATTGEESMPLVSKMIVSFEMLGFYLHAMGRFAYQAGGPEAKATIQDAVTQTVVQELVSGYFATSGNEKDSDIVEKQEWMTSDILELVSSAETEYSSCQELMLDSGNAPFREDSVVGKLAGRITRQVGRDQVPYLRLLIWNGALEALTKSGLKEQVRAACNVLP